MKYLNFLLEKKFLIEKMDKPRKLYYTTEKGYKLIDEVNNVLELMK
jgi:predicted transcriptional regulator